MVMKHLHDCECMDSIEQHLKPYRVIVTYLWLITYPTNKKAQRGFKNKPLKKIKRVVMYGRTTLMKILLLR